MEVAELAPYELAETGVVTTLEVAELALEVAELAPYELAETGVVTTLEVAELAP